LRSPLGSLFLRVHSSERLQSSQPTCLNSYRSSRSAGSDFHSTSSPAVSWAQRDPRPIALIPPTISPAGIARRPCVAYTSPKRVRASKQARLAFRRWRTKSCSGRWSWRWSRCTNRTFCPTRVGSGRGVVRTRRLRRRSGDSWTSGRDGWSTLTSSTSATASTTRNIRALR